MIKVEFNFKGNVTRILCSENDIIDNICKEFASKAEIDINNLSFLYSGNKLNLDLPFSQVIYSHDKENKTFSILVIEDNPGNLNRKVNINKSIFPICPICYESIKLEIKDFKINLFGCKNGHVINNILLNEYEKTQKLNLSKISCSECKINQKKQIIMKCLYAILVTKIYAQNANKFMIKIIPQLISI